MKRKAAVAGIFYPANPHELRKMVSRMVPQQIRKESAVCIVSPHAGFVYSGSVAGAVISTVNIPETCILIGPGHRHHESHFPLMSHGIWETPMGDVPVASGLAGSILKDSSLVVEDAAAHASEHSLEVQLPFLLYFQGKLRIVPLLVAYHADYEELEEIGTTLAHAVKRSGENVLIVASTDMSHYVTAEVAKFKDSMAIDRILDLDPRGLHDVVRAEDISMCGYQATTAALCAAKMLGARRGDLIKYQNSGDITGDNREVVGYAGIKIARE